MLREVTLLCAESDAESLSDLLFDAGAVSITVEDADRDSADESPLYGEPGMEPTIQAWKRSRLRVLVSEEFDAPMALAIACKAIGIEPLDIESDTEVPDENWVQLTQAQFSPTKVSDRLWIVPTWHETPNPDAINIRLDPGVAFGTGSHPTTHLCLKWLDANITPNKTVLDYGCGTGILAIAAAKLGAVSVEGTDIDPQAVEAATANAQANNVSAHFTLPDNLQHHTFDVVVANILSNPLKLLAPALLGRVSPGGYLVLSGILARQAEEVISVYRQADPSVALSVWQEEDGWVCIAGQKALTN